MYMRMITEEFVKHCEVSWVPDSVMVTQRRMPRCPILAGLVLGRVRESDDP
jgi:hypothetical protein